MMNHLLLWASARSDGTMGALKREIAASQLSHWAGRDLSKLAHIEIDGGSPGGWRAAPPVLAARQVTSNASAVLCGARTPALVSALGDAAEVLGGQMALCSQDRAPDVIEITASSGAGLVAIASRAGIYLQPRATRALISAAGPIASLVLEPDEAPIGKGWAVSRFSPSQLQWTESTVAAAHAASEGLFRFRSTFETKFLLFTHGAASRVTPSLGKYRVLQPRHRPLTYSARTRILRLPLDAPPPLLLERALVVASGRLPFIEDRRLCYADVELADAHAFAAQLSQKLF
jgi:hypothetical protein